MRQMRLRRGSGQNLSVRKCGVGVGSGSSILIQPSNSNTSAGSELCGPYCAIPRDYLSDTSLLRAMGILVSQYGRLGEIPPPAY